MSGPDLYRIRDFVPDFEAISAEIAARSAAMAQGSRMQVDLAYGAGNRETMDILWPENPKAGAPLHMFVHGGYWRSGEKSAYRCVAAPVLAAGGIAAIVEYDLMPATRLPVLVGQIRQAARWLCANASRFGADPQRFSVSGHSAGAHLASFLAAKAPGETDWPVAMPQALMLVSGIYDLSGIPASFLKDEAAMTADEAKAYSPLTSLHSPKPGRILVVGAEETAPFLDQARALQDHLALQGGTGALHVAPGLNHMNVVLALSDTNHALGQILGEMVADQPALSQP
jgi:arylformamidase